MFTAMLLSLTLASEPPRTVVIVGRRTALSAPEAKALAQRISQIFSAEKVPLQLDADASLAALGRLGVKDPSACSGRKACITELGRQLSATHVLNLSMSLVGGDLSIALELMTVDTATVLEKDALITTAAALSSEQLTPFAARVRTRLVPDAPVVIESPPPPKLVLPTPPPTPEPIVVVPVAPPAPKSRLAPALLGGGAVVVLGVATAVLISGLSARATAYRTTTVDGVMKSDFAASEVQRRASEATTQIGVSGGLAALAVGLGTGAVLSW